MIELCTVCYNYQRRLSWWLSSLYEQENPPDFKINLAYIKDNGNPRTEDIIDFWKDKLEIKPVVFESIEEFKFRGMVRNKQVEVSDAKWLFFADPDLVYPKDFLSALWGIIKDKEDLEKCVSSMKKYTTDVDETNKIIGEQTEFYIEEAYKKALIIPRLNIRTKQGIAGGGMQVVSRKVLFEKTGGVYSEKPCDKHLFKQKTFSDKHFRKEIGGSFMINNLVGHQIHLNHYRVTDQGYDVDQQR